MQMTISQQLNLDPNTVANFFMNARRRGHDRNQENDNENSNDSNHYSSSNTLSTTPMSSTSSSCASSEISHSSPFSMPSINLALDSGMRLNNKQITTTYDSYEKNQISYLTNYLSSTPTPQQQLITVTNCYGSELDKDIKPNELVKNPSQRYIITKLPKVEIGQ